MLQNFQIITQNSEEGEWAYHYSNGKYKRWEAERDMYYFLETGFKHPHPTPGVMDHIFMDRKRNI